MNSLMFIYCLYMKFKISSRDKINGLYSDKTWIIFQRNGEKRQIADCVGVVINKCHVFLRYNNTLMLMRSYSFMLVNMSIDITSLKSIRQYFQNCI